MRWIGRFTMVVALTFGLSAGWTTPAGADGPCNREPRVGEVLVRGRILDTWTTDVAGYGDEARIVRLQVDGAGTVGVPDTIDVLWNDSVSPWWRYERTVWPYGDGLWQESQYLCPNEEPAFSVATPAIPATLNAAIFTSTWRDALMLGLPTVVLLGLATASLRTRRRRHAHQQVVASRRARDEPDDQVLIDA